MGKLFISERPGGFKITLGCKKGGVKQLNFPRGEKVEVADEFVKTLECYDKFVRPYAEGKRVEPADDDGESESGATEDSEVSATSATGKEPPAPPKEGAALEVLGLQPDVVKALLAAGYKTPEDLAQAIDDGKDLTKLKGIGPATQTQIIAALNP